MSQHTPGPWTWHNDSSPDSIEGQYRRLDGPNNEDILTVEDQYQGYPECGEDLRIIVERPNERLIAAAPDLLEALTQCLTFLAPHTRPAPEDVYTAVLEAIRKAEGK